MNDDGWIEMEDEGFVGLVGPFFQRSVDGALDFRFPTAGKHCNRSGVVQGGALMTFADRVLGAAAREGRDDEITATVHMDVHFVAPVAVGETVEARPVVLNTRGRTVFVHADLIVGSRVVAFAHGVWKRLGERRQRRLT